MSRYARQFPVIGEEGQIKLGKARVFCVGAGGLGVPVLQYLTAAGVGCIAIADGDQVELSNLQRQVLYTEEDVGMSKVSAAVRRLQQLNSEVDFVAIEERIDAHNAAVLLEGYDVIIDATDNFKTRYLLNDISFDLKKPLVSASVSRFRGMLGVFNFQGGPCYRCLYPTPPASGEVLNCAEEGVLGVVPGLLGVAQAGEVIKLILQSGQPLSGKVLHVDMLSNEYVTFKVDKDADCPLCAHGEGSVSLFAEAVTAETLAHWRLINKDFQLLDVREAKERAIRHAGGVHIPLGTLDQHVEKLDRLQPVVVYCATGARSQLAAKLLRKNGFPHVFASSLPEIL